MIPPALLKSLPLFRDFTLAELRRIAALARRQRMPAGAIVFEEGQRGDALYIVEHGTLVIEKRPLTRGAPSLATLTFGPGQSFGELSLIDAGPRSAAARALEETDLIILKRAAFLRLLGADARLAAKLFRTMIGVLGPRVRYMNKELIALYEGGRLISACATIDELLPQLLRLLLTATGATKGVALLANELTGLLEPRASAGYPAATELPPVPTTSRDPIAIVFNARQPQRQVATRRAATAPDTPYHTGATLLVPIVAAEQATGVLLLNAPTSRAFRQDDANLVLCLGSQAAQAILRAKLVADAESQARLKQVRVQF